MDRHAADKVVTGSPEPHNPANLVDREEIEQSMSLWEEALSTPMPEQVQAGRETEGETIRRERTGSPLRAPLSDDLEIEPIRVEGRDGFVRSPREALRERLQDEAYEEIRVDVPVRLHDRNENKPARRVFWFDQPVDAAGESEGTLYALGEDGALIPFTGEVRARRVVEVIEKESFEDQPEKTVNLKAEVRSGIAHWSHV